MKLSPITLRKVPCVPLRQLRQSIPAWPRKLMASGPSRQAGRVGGQVEEA